MDDACAAMLAKSGIIPALIELLNGNTATFVVQDVVLWLIDFLDVIMLSCIKRNQISCINCETC